MNIISKISEIDDLKDHFLETSQQLEENLMEFLNANDNGGEWIVFGGWDK